MNVMYDQIVDSHLHFNIILIDIFFDFQCKHT